MNTDRTPQYIKLDERNHVEKPLLDQLEGLGWEIINLDNKQHPADSYRDSFTEVVLPAVLREQLKVINTWLEDDQVEEAVTQLEQQLSETSQSIGFSVKVPDSIRTLKELLRSDSSDLVMAMIHKFRETDQPGKRNDN
jgi:type I site-specific restriction-modification system R (restriction) subunit